MTDIFEFVFNHIEHDTGKHIQQNDSIGGRITGASTSQPFNQERIDDLEITVYLLQIFQGGGNCR